MARLKTIFALLLPGLFVTAIGLVLAMTDWRGSGDWITQFEMRAPAEMPARPHSWADAESWLDRLGTFFSDHFGLRQRMVDAEGRIQIELLKRSTSPQVLVGRNGFLFYTGQESIEDHRHMEQLTAEELKQWASGLKERYEWLSARGIRYLFVVCPNKNSVYPEDMPTTVHVEPGLSRIQQISNRLGNVPYFLDLTSTMRAARSRGLLYFQEDTHWDDLGAQIGFRAITAHLNIAVPPFVGKEVELVNQNYIPDLARLSGVSMREPEILRGPTCGKASLTRTDPAMYGPGDPAYAYPATTCALARGSLLIFHDSFTGPMFPYFADSFGSVVFVRRMPSFAQLKKAVEVEKPTVVIEERVERLLMYPLAE